MPCIGTGVPDGGDVGWLQLLAGLTEDSKGPFQGHLAPP